ncbi:nuclease-related domain-containing protein [Jeotgalibacillus sp. R-1-5s-1]|uniref:nuclease-related domain-containing protein n=1 Tax=Jeotgalibacillus sp. R-1-5s-1 TaxID=2555897 RepID=UPI00106C77CA|nr:nuclease-related domain-containing protein [Jeotgalibacillus sp. R-1-5s-1]TFD98168.1 NERD domain-containing protein [Jeotgalibacillus sp. R-1-5s-1]
MERKKSLDMLTLERLIARLDRNHTNLAYLEEELNRLRAGYKGECYLDSLTDPFTNSNFSTIKNLTLPSYFETIQYDQIHITPSFILIIECKNIIGKLTFQPEASSLKREINGVENYFRDPLWQIHRQEEGMKKILTELGLNIPVLGYIVFTSTNSSLHTANHQLAKPQKVIKSDQLTYHIRKLIKENQKVYLTDEQIKALTLSLKEFSIKPIWKDPLKKYNLKIEELNLGMRCPECNRLTLKKVKFRWVCECCSYSQKQLDQEQFIDYFLLINKKAKLKDLCAFYLIDDVRGFKHSLMSADIKCVGNTKSAEYVSWIHVIE